MKSGVRPVRFASPSTGTVPREMPEPQDTAEAEPKHSP